MKVERIEYIIPEDNWQKDTSVGEHYAVTIGLDNDDLSAFANAVVETCNPEERRALFSAFSVAQGDKVVMKLVTRDLHNNAQFGTRRLIF